MTMMKVLDNKTAMFVVLSMSMMIAQVESEHKFWFVIRDVSKMVAIAVGLFLVHLVQHWNRSESILYNLFCLIAAPVFKMEQLLDNSVDEQQAFLEKLTKQGEQNSSEGAAKMHGKDYWEASYGPHKTRVVELTVPSSYEDGYQVPVIVASPSSSQTQEEEGLPIVFYMFGGGLVMGSVKQELVFIRHMAKEANVVVVGIDYRTAPKYPYPIPLQDSLEAAVGILEKKVSLEDALKQKINFDKIATWGMSAGGYQSAHLARRLTEKGYKLKCQISLVPMVKPFGGTKSMIRNWAAPTWSGPNNTYAWASFLAGDDGTLAADWKVSLLVNPPETVVRNLPPTFIQISTKDVLRDEGEM